MLRAVRGTLRLDQRAADEFDRTLCDDSNEGRCP